MASARHLHAPRAGLGDAVDDCRRLGLRAVQLDGGLLADALERPERAAVLEEAGILLAGIGGYRNLVTPDESARRANVEYLCRCLELAPLLGTSIVATETGTRNQEQPWAPSPENRSPQALASLEESLAEVLAVADRHGSILALEGYVGHVIGTHAALQGVLDRFPTRSLQLVLDPYNYLSRHLLPSQERVTAAFLDRYEHRFVIAHAKDVGPAGAEESTPELGTGVFEQGPYLAFLERRRPDLPLILEHLPLENVAGAAGRVRRSTGPEYRAARRRGEHLARSPVISRLAEQRVVADVPVRVFRPDEVDGVYLHLHGGGFVYGSASLQDDRLERLAAGTVAVVERRVPAGSRASVSSCARRLRGGGALAREHCRGRARDRPDCHRRRVGGRYLAVVTMLRLRDKHGSRALGRGALVGRLRPRLDELCPDAGAGAGTR